MVPNAKKKKNLKRVHVAGGKWRYSACVVLSAEFIKAKNVSDLLAAGPKMELVQANITTIKPELFEYLNIIALTVLRESVCDYPILPSIDSE